MQTEAGQARTHQHRNHVHDHYQVVPLCKPAVFSEVQCRQVLAEDNQELDKLQARQVRPQRCACFGADRSQEIVPVHQDVNPRVQQGCQVEIAGGIELHRYRDDNRNGRVVEDVKEGDLSVRLAEHKNEGVQKLPILLVVEEPDAPLQQTVSTIVELTAAQVAHKFAFFVAEDVEQDADLCHEDLSSFCERTSGGEIVPRAVTAPR